MRENTVAAEPRTEAGKNLVRRYEATHKRLLDATATIRPEDRFEWADCLGDGLASLVREVVPQIEAEAAAVARRASDAQVELRDRVIHAARDVDGLWFPQDNDGEDNDLTFWGPEAGEALRDLRDAFIALDNAEPAATPAPQPATPPLDGSLLRFAIERHASEHKVHSRTHVRGVCADAIAAEYARLAERESETQP